MKTNRQYSISEKFEANLYPLNPKVEGDAITIDLGWKNGKREFIKFIGGELRIETVLPTANLEPLSDEDCDIFYDIYESMIHTGVCGDQVKQMISRDWWKHLGGAQGRNYSTLKHDPRLNLGELELLIKSYCRSQVKTPQKQFRQRVCRG